MTLIRLSYYAGNAWSDLYDLRREEPGTLWHWDSPEIENKVICFRRALKAALAGQVPETRLCQIHTNLGNTLSTIGRTVEAIWHYDNAIHREPNFGMAIGNRAMSMLSYARSLPACSDAYYLLKAAYSGAARAVELPLAAGAREHFFSTAEQVWSILGKERLEVVDPLDEGSLGRSKAERA